MKKIISFLLAFTMLFCLTACFDCDAEILIDGVTFKQEFIKNGRLKGDESVTVGNAVQIVEYNDTLEDRDKRIIVINNQNHIDEIFDEFPPIDFENEIILICAYRSYTLKPLKLESLKQRENKLTIKFDIVKNWGDGLKMDSIPPSTRYVIIKIEKIAFDSVELIYGGRML